MFYEETVINGRLHARTSPQGPWTELQTPRALALKALLALTQEDRESVLGFICSHCCQPHPAKGRCVCARDE